MSKEKSDKGPEHSKKKDKKERVEDLARPVLEQIRADQFSAAEELLKSVWDKIERDQATQLACSIFYGFVEEREFDEAILFMQKHEEIIPDETKHYWANHFVNSYWYSNPPEHDRAMDCFVRLQSHMETPALWAMLFLGIIIARRQDPREYANLFCDVPGVDGQWRESVTFALNGK